MSQLDLFSEAQSVVLPSALIVPFPLAKRCRTIRKTAATLIARKTIQGQEGYWRRTIEDLKKELRRHGVSPSEIDRQLSDFHLAVGQHIAADDGRQRPGGAA
ncbi:DUF6074 family protein [Devosia sp.]|uniref:DUF6074 family protein n=1 Tax=Devosia sp. TaxID=1871048 RepID=UPI00326726DF